MCLLCVFTGDHEQHVKIDILEQVWVRKDIIEKDLEESNNCIYPKLQAAASSIPVQRSGVNIHSRELTPAIKKQAEALHDEIETIVKDIQSEIDEMDTQHFAAIDQQEKEINQSMNEINQLILNLQNMLESNDAGLLSEYISRNSEFKNLPALIHVVLPIFIPQDINRQQIRQLFGILSKQAITRQFPEDQTNTTKEQVGLSKIQGAMPIRINDEPRVL